MFTFCLRFTYQVHVDLLNDNKKRMVLNTYGHWTEYMQYKYECGYNPFNRYEFLIIANVGGCGELKITIF